MKVGIVGGGITGLTTALALQKLGIKSVVYEQAKELNEIGAGIWLQPNAIKILDYLGLKNEVKELGIELSRMEVTNSELKPIKKLKNTVVQDLEGNQTIAIHRARLQSLLLNKLQRTSEIHLNSRYVKHSQSYNGVKVQFENSEDLVDVLLGADGINSITRRTLFPKSKLRSSGQVCWRGVSKMNLPDLSKKLGQEAWGRKIRFGFSQIYKGEVYWFAVGNEEHLAKSNEVGQKKYLLELFDHFSPLTAELISNTESSQIHQAILTDLNRLATWYEGKVCLLGDAAHACTPNMGQGACQGIEDAYYISRNLSKSLENPELAFKNFELERRKKVDYIVNTSWQFGKMAHSAIAQPLMKLVLKLTPEDVIKAQMNKLYRIDF